MPDTTFATEFVTCLVEQSPHTRIYAAIMRKKLSQGLIVCPLCLIVVYYSNHTFITRSTSTSTRTQQGCPGNQESPFPVADNTFNAANIFNHLVLNFKKKSKSKCKYKKNKVANVS